ncbi:hypothetical protein SeLEV6574_g06793 [Synchytrium endobioticum]|uniref:Uncharacterized protein n=1 Tax=Synchytrium endobioticum TaxID=286115 RepID=A0A507CM54_9FUNG|nr:hypothetical protein SeLEV6574_g06793 [Synchytrium endobioticum]
MLTSANLRTPSKAPYGHSKPKTPASLYDTRSFSTNQSDLLSDSFQDLVDRLDADEYSSIRQTLQHQNASKSSTSRQPPPPHHDDDNDDHDCDPRNATASHHTRNDAMLSDAPSRMEDLGTSIHLRHDELDQLNDGLSTVNPNNHSYDLVNDADDDHNIQNFSKLEGLTDLELTEYGIIGNANLNDPDFGDDSLDPHAINDHHSINAVQANHDVQHDLYSPENIPQSSNHHLDSFEWASRFGYSTTGINHNNTPLDQVSPEMSEASPAAPSGFDDNPHENDNHHHHPPEQADDIHPLLSTQLYSNIMKTPTPAPIVKPSFKSHDETQHNATNMNQPVHLQTPSQIMSASFANEISTATSNNHNAFDQMVEEMRNECRSLKALNERLLAANEDLRSTQTNLTLEHERALRDTRKDFENMMQKLQRSEDERRSVLERRIEELQQDLHHARSSASQMATIRATLEREKELDILQVKKDVMSQKERQLQDIRRELQRDKEDLQRRLRDEIESEKDARVAEKRRLESDLARAKRQLEQKDEELQNLEENMNRVEMQVQQSRRRPSTNEVGTQSDTAISLNSSYDDDLLFLFRELDTLFGSDFSASIRSNTIYNDAKVSSRARRLVDRCRSYVESTEQAILTTRSDLANLKTKYEGIIGEANRKMDEYKQQIVGLRKNRNVGNNNQQPSTPQTATLEDLERHYPSVYAQLKSDVSRQYELEKKALLASAENRRIRDVAETKRLAAEDTERMGNEIRQKCSTAYEKAVKRLKEEYRKLEAKLRAEIDEERKKVQATSHPTRDHYEQAYKDGYKLGREETRGDVVQLKQKILDLEQMTKQLTAAQVAEMEEKLKADNHAALMEAKQCYLTAKEKLDEQWKRRLDDLKLHYEQKLREHVASMPPRPSSRSSQPREPASRGLSQALTGSRHDQDGTKKYSTSQKTLSDFDERFEVVHVPSSRSTASAIASSSDRGSRHAARPSKSSTTTTSGNRRR